MDSQGGERRKPKKKERRKHLVKLISVAHAGTGVILFEHIYKWPEDTQLTSVGGLAQSFFQFAREVDDGNIVSVHFEGAPRNHRRAKTPTSTPSSRSKTTRAPNTMKMVTTKDDIIIMTVFYDTKGSLVMSDEVNSRLERLRDGLFDAFSSELGQVVRDNEALILDIADERKTPTDEEIDAMRDLFRSFEISANELREDVFPSHSTASMSTGSVLSPSELAENEGEEEEKQGEVA